MITGKKFLFTSHTANFSKFNRPVMRLLREQGNQVHYASAGEEPVLDCDKHFTIPFARSPLSSDNVEAIRQLRSLIEKEKYDVIHTHTPMGSVVTRLAARQVRKKYGTKVIYTAHGFHFFKGAPLLNWAVYYPIEKTLARFTDALVTINKEDFERANKKFATHVHYISGVGIDLERFKPVSKAKKNSLRKECGYKPNDFILIYIAELNANKNQTFLINQIKELQSSVPSIKLLFCGTGHLADKYKKMVSDVGLEDRIEFLGYRTDVETLLALSDVAVSSSKREGLGISLIEAMAVGLPLVASRNRGHIDVIEHGVNGYLYEIDDAASFRERVTVLYKDSKLANKIGKSNVSEAPKYEVRVALDSVQRIYEEVIR